MRRKSKKQFVALQASHASLGSQRGVFFALNQMIQSTGRVKTNGITNNTDMLDLNLPKYNYVFLRKHLEEGVYQVSAVSASDVLKRNTDSLRCAVENDVFASLPQDSLLVELGMGY